MSFAAWKHCLSKSIEIAYCRYSDVVLQFFSQNPQCEGVNQDRIFFNSKIPSRNRVFFKVSLDDNDMFIMDAGAAHSVTVGAEFTVYKKRDDILSNIPPLGILVVSRTTAFQSEMEPRDGDPWFVLDRPAFAVKTKAGSEEHLRLHIAPGDRFADVFQALAQEMQRTDPCQKCILPVDERDTADIEIAYQNDNVVFNILKPGVTRYGLTRIPFVVKAEVDTIKPILRAMAHYNWHLYRTNGNERTLHSGVCIEFKELQFASGTGFRTRHPVGENLNIDGVVDIDVSEGKMYGIKIINSTEEDLYPSLFYFDNSDLSICKSLEAMLDVF